MQPVLLSVGETQVGKQVCSFVSFYFSFKQNIMCSFKGGNSNSILPLHPIGQRCVAGTAVRPPGGVQSPDDHDAKGKSRSIRARTLTSRCAGLVAPRDVSDRSAHPVVGGTGHCSLACAALIPCNPR